MSKLAINLNKSYEKNYRICQIWDWEHGYREPSENDTKILADYFNVSQKHLINNYMNLVRILNLYNY